MTFVEDKKCCSLVSNSSIELYNNNTDFISDYTPTTNEGVFSFEVNEMFPKLNNLAVMLV